MVSVTEHQEVEKPPTVVASETP